VTSPVPGAKADVKERLRGATGCTDPDFVDFLASLLCYEPALRLTPRDAFFHPFMDDLLPFKALFASPPVNVMHGMGSICSFFFQ
jgi:hypothetical protein